MTFLARQLEQRGWSQRELARRSGLSQASVSRVMQGEYQAGPSFCEGIAKALDLPLETVLIEAGLIHGSAEIPPELREWAGRLRSLPDDQRRRTIIAMENVLRLSEGREPR